MNLRVEHVASVHDAVHVQLFGAVQVPPFAHPDEHTAEISIQACLDSILYECHLRVVHLVPVHDDVQEQTPGEEQTPPLEQTGEQTATK